MISRIRTFSKNVAVYVLTTKIGTSLSKLKVLVFGEYERRVQVVLTERHPHSIIRYVTTKWGFIQSIKHKYLILFSNSKYFPNPNYCSSYVCTTSEGILIGLLMLGNAKCTIPAGTSSQECLHDELVKIESSSFSNLKLLVFNGLSCGPPSAMCCTSSAHPCLAWFCINNIDDIFLYTQNHSWELNGAEIQAVIPRGLLISLTSSVFRVT
jgi:hypothetical protein